MGRLTRKIRLAQWTLNGYFGRTLSLESREKVTVLITYYHPARMNHIESQVRNILKCAFVDKVIVSNHNPDIRIENKVNIKDERLMCMNQDIRRACGYRWHIANSLQSEYLVVIDDDILLFPSQLKTLFQHLIREPKIPHGFSGLRHLESGEFEYRECEDLEVHYLCEMYAVTRGHIERYTEMTRAIAEQDEALLDMVERYCDFIVISQTAGQSPKIHNVLRLFKSDTFKTAGIAIHRDAEFAESIGKVSQAVERIRAQNQAPAAAAFAVPASQLARKVA